PVRRGEGCLVRQADAADGVPGRPAGGQRQRRARRRASQAALRIEEVEQGEEVVLVRAPAVEEDERARRISGRRSEPVSERVEPAQRAAAVSRGFGSGVRSGSTCERRCSKAGGSESRSPRCSIGSSVAKPGPIVAISKRTPLGSRK